MKLGEGTNHYCQHVHQASLVLDLLGSSWCALLLAQHFIRQARTRRDTHLKVLIRYHSTMSVIFIYLCHLICLVVISSLCSFICFPSSSCPPKRVTVCFSICHFLSVIFVWSEMSHGCLITLTESQSEQSFDMKPLNLSNGQELLSKLQLFTVIHQFWVPSTVLLPSHVRDS